MQTFDNHFRKLDLKPSQPVVLYRNRYGRLLETPAVFVGETYLRYTFDSNGRKIQIDHGERVWAIRPG